MSDTEENTHPAAVEDIDAKRAEIAATAAARGCSSSAHTR